MIAVVSAGAATKTWDGGGGNGNWSTAANWNADGVPTSSDAVVLDNSVANPVPQIAAQSGASCGTLTIDGAVNATFLNYGGATPLVTNLYGASVNAANTGPLLQITTNAPALVSANKVNFQLRTNGELFVAAGRTLSLSNSFISQNGTRTLTKTGAGTVQFSGSGSLVSFTGGLNMAEGTWNAGTDTENLPVAGVITFTNASGVAATITSTNSHSIAGLAGGNASSEIYATGTTGLTITGSAVTTFSGRIRGATKLNYAGTGILTLNGNNTFTGTTTISSGTLKLGASGVLSGTPSLDVAGGAIFDVSAIAAGFTVGSGKTFSGSGAVTGKLTAAGGATISPAGTLTISNGFTLGAGATLDVALSSAASYDSVVVTGGNVSLAGMLAASLGYTAAIGDTVFLVRNDGAGTSSGTLSGVGDGGKLDIGGKWWRVSFTSDFGGSGFAVGGAGNDVALQRIDDPSPSGPSLSIVGATGTAVVQLSFSWVDNAATETGYRVYRVLADGSLELAATLAAGATTFTETVSGYTAHTYAVQAFDGAGTLGDLTYSAPFQTGTSFAARQDAMLDYLSTEVPNLGQSGAGPHRIGRVGFWCAAGRMLRGDTATGISYITTAVEDANAEGANAGFSMWPGMDAYMRWNHLFPQSLKDRYQQIYVGADAYDNGSTPNQRFMLAVASYLANGVWGTTVNSTASASNGIGGASGKDFILHILNKTPFDNHEEHNSHHYLTYTLSAIETLAQFAQDAEVRDKARMVVTWSCAEAAGYMHNGRWAVSSTRGRPSDQQNAYGNTDWTWYLLFGGPAPTSYFDSFATAPFLMPQFPAVHAEVLAAGQQRTQSYGRRSLAQRYLSGGDVAYFKQSWVTPGYTLFSQVEGDVTYHADGSMNLLDVNTTGIQDGYQGNRWGLAWDSPPGNDSMMTITTPTTYSGTTSGISVWEDTLQHEGTVIAVYNMPTGGGGSTGNNGNFANEYIKGDIPNGYLAYIDQSDALGRIFLHYDSVLVSIQLTDTFGNFSGSPGFQYTCNKQGVIVETALPSEYPQATAADRLAAFRSDILANTVTDKTGINDAAPKLIYTNRGGDVLELTWGLAGKINGVTVDYQSWPMLEDPRMVQAQNGHLHLLGANRTVTNNYHSWTQSINTRPVVTGNAPIAAVAASPVDVDLAARIADGETADAILRFTVSNATGGTVSLLADGKTARFTPNAGSSGTATFDFATSDRGLHRGVVWHYDFETSATHDASGHDRHATQTLVGTGSAALQSDTPAPLAANSTQSLRLTESSPNAAKLTRIVTRSNLEMSNGSWTFATWFKRASRTTDDFLLYIGAGDGFSGNGDELQLRCGGNADTLRLEHYNAANTGDLTLISPGTAVQNVWHHAAITFEKTADNTGTVRLYLNGTQVGAPTTVTWALRQDLAIVLGGIASTSGAVTSRYFNGWLDDAALFRGAMSATEIASLASQSVATFSGLTTTATVPLQVVTQQQNWRQTHFSTTADTGNAADLSDGNSDGETNLIEFATAQNPHATTRIAPALVQNGATLEYTYTRSQAAVTDGLLFTVEWSDDLSTWSSLGVTSSILTDNGTTQQIKATIPAGVNRRFVHLKVTRP
ncbi:MAG: autotransporter-associated beta strand repeat-containing protein [Verrucomicrobiaceae bacterium]|nr:autotransporter-associated beta strand repeat-containing protein [Verrucomicrobiaceae bacterium]